MGCFLATAESSLASQSAVSSTTLSGTQTRICGPLAPFTQIQAVRWQKWVNPSNLVVSHDLSRKNVDFHGDLLIQLGTKNYGSGMQWLGNMTQNGNAQVDWQFDEKAWI